MTNWGEPCQLSRHGIKRTHMRVLIARRLIVLLRKVLRKSGHRNSAVKSNVMKLQGVRAWDWGTGNRFSQIISQ